ncbi:MAG: cysteine desulfurase [archaeon]
MKKYREDFLILRKKLKGKSIIYFDNACMTLKPIQVVNKINEYYNEYPACGGRSQHQLGSRVTEEVNETRKLAAKSLNAKKSSEIVFTKNTTESINLIANSLDFKEGDKVLTTDREHNSNLIPWQIQTRIQHETIPSNQDGTFNLEKLKEKLTKKVKLLSVVHTSNLDGYTLPVKEIIKLAHNNGTLVLLDAAQSAPHQEVNVKKLDVDFLACSGHKMMGPTGTGILYGKERLLNNLKPFIVGGETVTDSTYKSQTFDKIPHKFEAGLQNYAGIIGLGAAIKYLNKIGMDKIQSHEQKLGDYIRKELTEDKIELINPQSQTSGIFSFNIKGMDSHMVALTLDKTSNIMIRSGHHCVHSWFNAHKINGSARASLYLYNTKEECELFCEEVKKIVKHFA